MKKSRVRIILMEIELVAFSPLYPTAFVRVINALNSPNGMLSISALYP